MKSILWLLAFLFILASCKIEVQDEFPDFEKHLSLNSYLVAGDILQVHVSYAAKLDNAQLDIVDNATVDLFVDNEFVEQLSYFDKGLYVSTVIAEAQKVYTCKVAVPSYNEVRCSQTLPGCPVITNIEHINIAGKDEEGTSYPAIKLTFKNKIANELFYEIEIRTIRRNRDEEVAVVSDIHTIVDPVILNEGIPLALFSNELIQDSAYTMILNYTTNGAEKRGDGPWRSNLYPFVVELRQVTEDYYRFKKQLYLYEEGRYADGIITSMTNANLYSNIENGYGIFAGYSFFVSDTITPNTDDYYF